MLGFMSLPTWIIHLSGVAEWFLAMWLFWVLGQKLKNKWLKIMPLFMMPYMLSGWCAIAYHITYDTMEVLNLVQAILTFAGSCAFALWSFLFFRDLKKSPLPKLKRKTIYPNDMTEVRGRRSEVGKTETELTTDKHR